MFEFSVFAVTLLAGIWIMVALAVGMSKFKLAAAQLLFTTLLASGCASTAMKASHQIDRQYDLSGDWRVYYDIPDTMMYGLTLSVTINEAGLPDQSGNWATPEDPNSHISEGVVDAATVSFRWIYQNMGANVKTGPVLWDYGFEGRYELSENGEYVLRGTLAGTEMNGLCEFPVSSVKPAIEKLPNGECPRHHVTGTWYAIRDLLQ